MGVRHDILSDPIPFQKNGVKKNGVRHDILCYIYIDS
jgi:hypothetical protein